MSTVKQAVCGETCRIMRHATDISDLRNMLERYDGSMAAV